MATRWRGKITCVRRGAGGWHGVLQLFFGLVLLVFGGCSPQNLAALKGEQAIPVQRILTSKLLARELGGLR